MQAGTNPSNIGRVPVQDIGAGTPLLGGYYFLAASALTVGVTYFDLGGEQVGLSTTLDIPAASGAVATAVFDNPPANAVGADFTHTGLSAVDVYIFTPREGQGATEADFMGNYTRFRRKAIEPTGTRIGR